MRIDSGTNPDAFAGVGDTTGDVQSRAAIGVLKETMDAVETTTMELLRSLQPHLGQNVDVRV